MKRILYLAYHFPPIGGSGVQRNSKFVKYLPEFGYDSVVVSGPGTAVGRWTPHDQTLLGDVPPGTEIHRVPGPEPGESSGWRGRAERWLRLENPWSRWWVEGAVSVGREVGRDVDLVYAAMAPFQTTEAAARLSRELGKPWVADLQDPWALDEMWIYPTWLHRRLATRDMRRRLASASAIVMNTPDAAALVRRRLPEFAQARIAAITNGFDPEDFAGPAPQRDDGKFRIVHTGYLHTDLGRWHRRTDLARRILGGANARVDIMTRSHLYLLEAIDRLLAEDHSLVDSIEVHFAGVLTEVDRALANSPGVRMHGFVSHEESVALLRSADLLFLPMHDLPDGQRMSIVPGKTYEYLGSRKPILGAVPDGDARDFLIAAGNAFVCRPSDSGAMAKIIREQVERWRAGEAPPEPVDEARTRFERRELTRRLAEVFDDVVGRATPERRAAVAS